MMKHSEKNIIIGAEVARKVYYSCTLPILAIGFIGLVQQYNVLCALATWISTVTMFHIDYLMNEYLPCRCSGRKHDFLARSLGCDTRISQSVIRLFHLRFLSSIHKVSICDRLTAIGFPLFIIIISAGCCPLLNIGLLNWFPAWQPPITWELNITGEICA